MKFFKIDFRSRFDEPINRKINMRDQKIHEHWTD